MRKPVVTMETEISFAMFEVMDEHL